MMVRTSDNGDPSKISFRMSSTDVLSMVRFLQVTVSVMTRDPHEEELLKKNDPRIRNDLLMLLSNQHYNDISTREGKEKLRVASLEAVRTVVKSAGGEGEKIEDLYFTAFVMQ